MDDLDAVRAALGYRQLDVIGSSYGATAAQVYLKLHPSSVRTLILLGRNCDRRPLLRPLRRQRPARARPAREVCASQPDCRKAFPDWERQFGELVKAWNAHPVHGMTGDEFASVVHAMLLDLERRLDPAGRQPRREGDYAPLEQADRRSHADLKLMVFDLVQRALGRARPTGPWGTEFDSYTTAQIAAVRHQCGSVPKRAEPRSLWRLPASSRVPVLALVGGADPQDPVTNLSNLKQHFPDSRTVVFPQIGHEFGVGGCVDEMMADLVDRGTTKGLDTTRCEGAVVVPPFP